MNTRDLILTNQSEFLKFLKSKFTLIHTSNVFFRDFHYGVMSYLHDHGIKLQYREAEDLAREITIELEKREIFKKIDYQSWKLNYPEFTLPRVEKVVVEKKAS
jgi:hypothetical protein